MKKEACMAVCGAIIPELLVIIFKNLFPSDMAWAEPVALIFAIIVSIPLLYYVLEAIDYLMSDLKDYRGQWVELLTSTQTENFGEQSVGIGIIRYDRKTKEHTFTGKTYSKSGDEIFSWGIQYLRPENDSTVQYVCEVDNPNQRSLGRITFINPNECAGSIWVMTGRSYVFNASRVTKELLEELGIADKVSPAERSDSLLKRFFGERNFIVRQADHPRLAVAFLEKRGSSHTPSS